MPYTVSSVKEADVRKRYGLDTPDAQRSLSRFSALPAKRQGGLTKWATR